MRRAHPALRTSVRYGMCRQPQTSKISPLSADRSTATGTTRPMGDSTMQARALYEAAVSAGLCAEAPIVNDIHSRLNPTRVERIVRPRSTDEVVATVRAAATEGRAVAISAGRHAMGGQ